MDLELAGLQNLMLTKLMPRLSSFSDCICQDYFCLTLRKDSNSELLVSAAFVGVSFPDNHPYFSFHFCVIFV